MSLDNIYRQYWTEFISSCSLSGEKTTRVRFSSRYATLDVNKKIRLLQLSGRDEIAADILTHHFSGLAPHTQVQLDGNGDGDGCLIGIPLVYL